MLADFGLACRITDEQQMSRRCGSAGFVAPEVCLGTPYDCKVDNFGAGVVLYFMLSRETPFSSPDRDSAATMRKTVKCSLHLQRPPFDSMTSRLRNILRQLICKSQDDRLTAAAALEHSWIVGKSDKTGSSSSSKKKREGVGAIVASSRCRRTVRCRCRADAARRHSYTRRLFAICWRSAEQPVATIIWCCITWHSLRCEPCHTNISYFPSAPEAAAAATGPRGI